MDLAGCSITLTATVETGWDAHRGRHQCNCERLFEARNAVAAGGGALATTVLMCPPSRRCWFSTTGSTPMARRTRSSAGQTSAGCGSPSQSSWPPSAWASQAPLLATTRHRHPPERPPSRRPPPNPHAPTRPRRRTAHPSRLCRPRTSPARGIRPHSAGAASGSRPALRIDRSHRHHRAPPGRRPRRCSTGRLRDRAR